MRVQDVVDSELTYEELEEAVRMRREEDVFGGAPKPLSFINYIKVREILEEIIFDMAHRGYRDSSDDEYQVYEAAMESVYGPKIWDWINSR